MRKTLLTLSSVLSSEQFELGADTNQGELKFQAALGQQSRITLLILVVLSSFQDESGDPFGRHVCVVVVKNFPFSAWDPHVAVGPHPPNCTVCDMSFCLLCGI